MKFSIIVPTHNRYILLKRLVRQLLSLDYPKDDYEIIVVNNTTTVDKTQIFIEETSKNESHFHYHQEPLLGPSFARNAGIKKARYPYQILIDDDIEVKCSLLKDFKKAWENHPDAVGIGGKIITKPISSQLSTREEKLVTQHTWVFGQQDKGVEEIKLKKGEMLLSGTFGIHQKFNNLFLFDTNLGIKLNNHTVLYGEDFELCGRLIWSGCEIWYVPTINTVNYFDPKRLTHKYLSKRYFINGIEIYVADFLLKKRFATYNSSYQEKLQVNLFNLFLLNFDIFKNILRTLYDPIMMSSYFFCGKYFLESPES